MSQPHLISLVITTYNRSDALAVVLASLASQDDHDFEIVIADDGSTSAHQDAVCAAVQRLGLRATCVWHPDVGFTAAQVRNLGVAAARGDYIVLLDGDCVLAPDFGRRHRDLARPGCFVNGSRVLLAPALTAEVLAQRVDLPAQGAGFWAVQRLSGQVSKLTGLWRLPRWWPRRQIAYFYWKRIRSCNMAVWRQDYIDVNGFDESFVGWGHEDADFVLRLHNKGIRRINGYWATEAYHLWHPQAVRAHASRNAQRVRERMQTGAFLPTTGYSDNVNAGAVVVSTWG